VETINQDIGSKRKSAAIEGVKKTRTLLNKKSLTNGCRDAKVCDAIVADMMTTLDPLEASLKDSLGAYQGSDQERTALDAAYAKQTILASQVGAMEENMVPANYVTPVPDDYNDLPQLQGRATVEMILKKEDGGVFDVNGQNFPTAKLTMVIDGYAGA